MRVTVTPKRLALLRDVAEGRVLVVVRGGLICEGRDNDLRVISAEARRLADAGLIKDGGPKVWNLGGAAGEKVDPTWRVAALTDAGRRACANSGAVPDGR